MAQMMKIKMSFVWAGLMFGIYMVLAALLTWVQFSPVLNVMKAILITVIAISSLSTYLYCEYLVFGKKIGFALDVFTVASWQILIPLGVMGIWQLMSNTATTALMVPIAVSLAQGLGADPRAVVIATVIAGSCAYATPIGMPANTMVVGIGGYKFIDYVKAGLPLILVSFIICMVILPVAYPFFPA